MAENNQDELANLRRQLAERDAELAERDAQIAERDAQIGDLAAQRDFFIDMVIHGAVERADILNQFRWTADVLNGAIYYLWARLQAALPPAQQHLAIAAPANVPVVNAAAVRPVQQAAIQPALENLFDLFYK